MQVICLEHLGHTVWGGCVAILRYLVISKFLLFKDEISNHVWPGLLDVYTYYGSDRTRDSDDLVKKDIVLTTYQTVSSDRSKVLKLMNDSLCIRFWPSL